MDLTTCKFCKSSLVNIISIKIKDKEQERNINVNNEGISINNINEVANYFRCLSCAQITELIFKNKIGCCMIEQNRYSRISQGNKNISSKVIF